MKDILMLEPRLLDMDWKIGIISDAKNKAESNQFKITVKLVLENADGKGVTEKFLEFTPVQFFDFYKNANDCKNLLDMAQ